MFINPCCACAGGLRYLSCVCVYVGGWLGVGLGVCLLPRAMAKAVAKFVEKGALALIERARAIGRRSMLLSRPQC